MVFTCKMYNSLTSQNITHGKHPKVVKPYIKKTDRCLPKFDDNSKNLFSIKAKV